MLRFHPRYPLLPMTVLLATAFVAPCLAEDEMAYYDRPLGNARQSRSVVVAKHGIVATSVPLAAQVGVDILKAGGNAADAAIATNAMLGLTEPMSCGIGGDLFVIYWDNKSQKLYGLNGSGRSPYSLNRAVFRERGLQSIPGEGVLSWSVPGCVDGWETLRVRFGTKPLSEIQAPAIEYAEQGFPVTEIIAGYWRHAAPKLEQYPGTAKTYLIDGHAPAEGELFRNPLLAASYRAIAMQGPAAFYQGTIAGQIAEYAQAHGGYLTRKDLADHSSEWVEPVSTNYRGYDVWELPPNGQGIAALQMLNLIEPHDVRAMGVGSPEWYHLFVEAKKLAFADRARWYADPAFAKLPIAELISKRYAVERAKRLSLQTAATDVPAGDPLLERSDTVYLTVVDQDRNCCSFIQSNFAGFGSWIVPGDVGFVMQNRGQLFSLDDTHLNRLEPHKRPFHTIIPAMVTKDGKPWFCFGVMGGDMQAQGHVQVLVNMIDFGMNPQLAGDAARIRHEGSASPTGDLAASDGGTVIAERQIPESAVSALRTLGHRVERGRGGGFGGYQGILIDWKHGTLIGATESRKDGCAAGY